MKRRLKRKLKRRLKQLKVKMLERVWEDYRRLSQKE